MREGEGTMRQEDTICIKGCRGGAMPWFTRSAWLVGFDYAQSSAGLSKGSRLRRVLRVLVRAGVCAGQVCVVLAVSAAPAGAFANVGASPQPGPTGLPDGRVYEQVSPPSKNGNLVDFAEQFDFGLARADGDAVIYPLSGAAGTAYSGTVSEYVSRRTPGVGWDTEQALPRQTSPEFKLQFDAPTTFVPSTDFIKFLFAGTRSYVQGDKDESLNIFFSTDPTREPQWLSQPQIASPVPGLGKNEGADYVVTGASADLGSAYFSYAGTLLPEDSERAAYVRGGQGDGSFGVYDDPWGFYEWNGDELREAGVLPDGKPNPFGAVPAPIGLVQNFGRKDEFQAGSFDNWVSSDGRRALFVSPDPIASSVSDPATCSALPPCTSEPPQLYLRETHPGGVHTVVLVSHSTLPGQEGDPAPDGASSLESPTGIGGTYAFGTPDGKHVFFASSDYLTKPAQESGVGGAKIYDYEVETGSLTYLPNVQGEISATSNDGSELSFVNTALHPNQLELWRRAGGVVTPVTELPPPQNEGLRSLTVRYPHFSADGSTLVFETNSPLPGGFNNGGLTSTGVPPLELYRYEVPVEPASAGSLTCISCPPVGVTPIGDAYTSYDNRSLPFDEVEHPNGSNSDAQTTIEPRAISANGDRIFFDTPNALVPQDTNGVRDVYEWEEGHVDLISSGAGGQPSFYLDSSESGGDVFFATTTALSVGDTDEAYDVYDARIPRPGDNPPPAAAPCKGSACQGPPAVPQSLGPPASATFVGAGNISPSPSTPAATTSLKRCSRGKKLSHGKCVTTRKAKKKKTRAKKTGKGRRVKR